MTYVLSPEQKERYSKRAKVKWASQTQDERQAKLDGMKQYQKSFTPEKKAAEKERKRISYLAEYPTRSPERKSATMARAKITTKQRMALPEPRIRDLVYGAKCRAAQDDIPYDEDLADFLLKDGPPLNCLCCKVRLVYETGKGRSPQGPSLDKVVNDKGYTNINTRVICVFCNLLKREGTAEDHQSIADYIRRELCIGIAETTAPPEDGRDLFVLDPVPVVPTEAFVEGG